MAKMSGDEFRGEVSSLLKTGTRILDILTAPAVGDVEMDEWESLTRGLRHSIAKIALEVADEASEILQIIERIAPFILRDDPMPDPLTPPDPPTRTPPDHFQGPGTSGHPSGCGCAACRNFDD